MISIQQEPLEQILGPQLDSLLRAHWEEIALHRDAIALEPDFERYRNLEESGSLVCLTARDGGHLIGYAAWILSQHLHYLNCRTAMNDVIYIAPAYRSTSTAGIRLIRECERRLGEVGVQRILWHVKPQNDWRQILQRLGYCLEEHIMGKLVAAS